MIPSFTHIRFAICSKKLFRTEDIETIVKCFGCEFERFALSKLGWLPKIGIESCRTTSDFPFSAVFVYSKNTGASEPAYVIYCSWSCVNTLLKGDIIIKQ